MKTKKRNRAQLLERLYDVAHDTATIKKHIDFGEPIKYITTINVLHKGETMTEAYCHNCGEKYIRTPIWGRVSYYPQKRGHFQCPNCGNTNLVDDHTYKLNEKKHKLILKTPDGFEFVTFYTYMMYRDEDDWYNKEPEHHIQITSAGIFDRNSGFYISERTGRNGNNYKVVRRGTFEERSTITWLKDFTNSNVSDEECRELLREGNEYYEKQNKESNMRRIVRQEKKEEKERLEREERMKAAEKRKQEYEAMRLADKRWMYNAKTVDIESMFPHPIFYSLYSAPTNGDKVYVIGCSKCNTVEEVAGIDVEGEYTCPHCGNHVEQMKSSHGGRYGGDYSQSAVVFENTDLEENDLLIRIFRCRYNMGDDREIFKECCEQKRIFAGEKPNVYFRRAYEKSYRLEKSDDTMEDIFTPNNDGTIITQSDNEIAEIVQRSCLKYSGLLDSWGLGKYKYDWSTNIPDLKYLRAWYANPGIEVVMKSNLEYLTDYYIDYPERMGKGNTLHELLDVTPGVIKMLRKRNPTYEVMRDIDYMYETDNTMTLEVFDQIVVENLHMNEMKDIASKYEITYDKILKYLQSSYDHQCILKNEALKIWSDYLRMAKRLGVNLSDKSKKFPSSLKKEHDIAMFAYRAVKIEMDAKEFAEQAKINAKYEFEDENMMVVIPKTPQEVIEEANHQNNCLRSYVERVKRGETVVAFVRQKSNPDKTFLSAEIYNNELRQLKGFCNSNPRTPNIVEFMNKWTEACNITIKC